MTGPGILKPSALCEVYAKDFLSHLAIASATAEI